MPDTHTEDYTEVYTEEDESEYSDEEEEYSYEDEDESEVENKQAREYNHCVSRIS